MIITTKTSWEQTVVDFVAKEYHPFHSTHTAYLFCYRLDWEIQFYLARISSCQASPSHNHGKSRPISLAFL